MGICRAFVFFQILVSENQDKAIEAIAERKKIRENFIKQPFEERMRHLFNENP